MQWHVTQYRFEKSFTVLTEGARESVSLKNAFVFDQMRRIAEPLQGTPLFIDTNPGRRSKTSLPWASICCPFRAKRHFTTTLIEFVPFWRSKILS
jgi:hypothetical protein